MPNRLIKESICTSQNLNELSPEEEIFFYRLIVNCDDYGRMDARPAILRARLFPLRIDNIKEDHINQWLQSLVKYELLDIYEVNEQRYLQVKTWENHQQIRAKRSKYPDPDGNLITIDSIGNQVLSSAIKSPRNPIQSESESNPNIYIVLFNIWNNLKIITHKKLTSDMKRAIDISRKDYSQEDIEQAMRNYAVIAKGSEYYWSHKWTLIEFLSRRHSNNIERFMDLEVVKSNFKKKENIGGKRSDGRQMPTEEQGRKEFEQ